MKKFYVKLRNDLKVFPVCVILTVDGREISRSDVIDESKFEIEFDDRIDHRYEISINLSGKSGVETAEAGDTTILIDEMSLDGMDVLPIFERIGKYTHSGNGYLEQQEISFTTYLGFDGKVDLSFETPIWKWFYRNQKW